MNKIQLLITCLTLWVLGCSPAPIVKNQASNVSEAPFVEAFLRLQFTDSLSEGVPLVIEQNLSIQKLIGDKQEADFATDLIREAEGQDKRLAEAVKEFCRKNTGTNTLESIGTIGLKHVVLTDKEMTELFEAKRNGSWDKFYKVYPKSPGIITLSRPGFSTDGNLAVIYMGNQSDWLAGHGRIYVLEKRDGKWIKAGMSIGPGWMS